MQKSNLLHSFYIHPKKYQFLEDIMKPKILISKCLGFEACRYDGSIIRDKFIQKLIPFIDFYTICPEVEIGLPIPRESIRIIKQNNLELLVSSKTGEDFTDAMQKFSKNYLETLESIDGAILKHRSPSCGKKDVKTYPTAGKCMVLSEKTSGFFAREVQAKFPNIILEDEGRLKNLFIREHFLTTLFTTARFRAIKPTKQSKALIEFHSSHKYLFMSYSPQIQKTLGKLTAHIKENGWIETIHNYEREMSKLFLNLPQKGRIINTLDHIFGYFSKQLSPKEKEFYSLLKEQYLNNKISASVLKTLLKSWSIRFQEDYIEIQQFFDPFPTELMTLSDSGK
jgi:uncharacterized protein YbbK (DUF523 family)/uncharacterized protein YbgA (DUF1722 family)